MLSASQEQLELAREYALKAGTVHAKSNHLEGNSELHHVEDSRGWVDKL